MNPDLVLGVMSALVGFVLKTALAFGVCLGLSWLVKSPARRFLVWSGFLYGTAAYWVWMAKSVLATKQVVATTVLAPTTHSVAQPAMSGFDALPIPGSWAFPLGMALRVIGIAYLLVSTYLLVMQIKKHLQLKWVLGFTSQPPKEIAAGFQMLAENAGVGRSRLLVLSGVSSPATCGFVGRPFSSPMLAWNRTTLISKLFCAMSCTTFVDGISSGTTSPLPAGRFFSFIRRVGMQSNACSSTANSHATLPPSPILQKAERSTPSA